MENIYAKHLERQLNEGITGVKFEVVMLSIGALNTVQEAHLLEIEGMRYDPDLIVIGYVLNDPGIGQSLNRAKLRNKNQSIYYEFKLLLKQSSLIFYTYRTFAQGLWKLSMAVGIKDSNYYIESDSYNALHKDPSKWNNVVESFKKMRSLCEEKNINAVLVIFPIFYRLNEYPWQEIHQQVADAALEENFAVLDLLEYYKDHDESMIRLGMSDHIHPNKFGHQIAGDALYEFLQNHMLLPVRNRS